MGSLKGPPQVYQALQAYTVGAEAFISGIGLRVENDRAVAAKITKFFAFTLLNRNFWASVAWQLRIHRVGF